MTEVGLCVIAAAEVELHSGTVHFYGNPAVLAVPCCIGRVIANEVVHGRVVLYALENLTEVVGVEEGLATGVGGESDQRFLCLEVRIQRIELGLTGVGRGSAQAGILRFTTGRQGLQAANVERVERQIGDHGCVGGGTQLRLVLDTRALHATGEVDERLLLRHVSNLIGDGAQCLESAIGVEDVVLSVVDSERARSVGRAFGCAG